MSKALALLLVHLFLFNSGATAGSGVLRETSVNIKKFGAKGDHLSDDRAAFQKAIDYCSKNKTTLYVSQGSYLLNSYSFDEGVAAHRGILELKSNLKIYIEKGAEIIAGEFFNDKSFVLFCGFNSLNPANFRPISNISIVGKGTISFSGKNSKMVSKYVRRIGMEGGVCTNVEVGGGLVWKDGDLSNCIVVGYGNKGSNVKIYGNTFQNLVVSSTNIDHSTIYSNAEDVSIEDNLFIGNLYTSLVGCCAELHGSKSVFKGNTVKNYTRMNYIASVQIERGAIGNIQILSNSGTVTNAMVYFWPEKDISNVRIANNNILHRHVGNYSTLHNGIQGLAVFEDKGGQCNNIQFLNNKSEIIRNINIPHVTKRAIDVRCSINKLTLANNIFTGNDYGVNVSMGDKGILPSVRSLEVSNNIFNSLVKLVEIDAKYVNGLNITLNKITLVEKGLSEVISVQSPHVENSYVGTNSYKSTQPISEFKPSKAFKETKSNRAKYLSGSRIIRVN